MVHVYYGDGKGKTTAAIGLAIRCCGNGQTVLFTQFLKSDNSGERRILECIPSVNMPELPKSVKFVFDMTAEEHAEYKEKMIELYNCLAENISNYDMIVADEIFSAVDVGFITTSDIIDLINKCPRSTELVLTDIILTKVCLFMQIMLLICQKLNIPMMLVWRQDRALSINALLLNKMFFL